MIFDNYGELNGFNRRNHSKRIANRILKNRARGVGRSRRRTSSMTIKARGKRLVMGRKALTSQSVSNIPSQKVRTAFFYWLEKELPTVYKAIKLQRPELISSQNSNLSGYDDGLGASWVDNITDIFKATVPLYQQNKIMKAQLKRAEQNLPPFETAHITPPGIPVRVELPPEIQKEVTGGLTNIKNMIPVIGLSLAALFVLPMIMRRKR